MKIVFGIIILGACFLVVFAIMSFIATESHLGHVVTVESSDIGERGCKHENICNSTTSCAVYHGGENFCWVCPDCSEYVSSSNIENRH